MLYFVHKIGKYAIIDDRSLGNRQGRVPPRAMQNIVSEVLSEFFHTLETKN